MPGPSRSSVRGAGAAYRVQVRVGGGGARAGGSRTGGAGGGGGPIFGGRQATQVRVAAVRRGRRSITVPTAGMGATVSRGRRARADSSSSSIVVVEEDSDTEGESVDGRSDEDEEEEDGVLALDDSLRDFIEQDSDDLLSDSEGETDLDVTGDYSRADETFSREVEEFELMEEEENRAARKAEERLRKREDEAEKENKNALRTDMFGSCTVCAEDEVVDPVGCIFCAGFIGCRKCATRWYRMSKENDENKIASCPLCREKWPSPTPEVGEMLDLVKMA